MGKTEEAIASELLRQLFQRSGAQCEGDKLGFVCDVTLRDDLEPLIHHIDGNPRNNDVNNLVLLCPTCHSKVIERLSKTRRKTYVQKVAKDLDKRLF